MRRCRARRPHTDCGRRGDEDVCRQPARLVTSAASSASAPRSSRMTLPCPDVVRRSSERLLCARSWLSPLRSRRSPRSSRSTCRSRAAARRCRCRTPSTSRRCCCSAPNETMIVAAASAWSQCTFRIKERNPRLPHALQHGVPGLTVQAAGCVYRWLGGTPGDRLDAATLAEAARRRRDDLLRRSTRC